ncbi:hypothetical protein BG005_002752 [Podila minutissima]|nr:hypothetical protein BG005_002752 [Podila minutissima]
MRFRVHVLFMAMVLAATVQVGKAKIKINPGFTKNLLDVVGNWLGIAQVNMGDFYNWSHQCNWWGIKHLIHNCPTYDPTPDEDTFVDAEDD